MPSAATPSTPALPASTDYEDISEEALEFNPDSTDVSKVFIEQPPSPEFKAATGTFNALRLEAEDAARAERERARTDTPPASELELVDTQVEVEIDPDVLATMASLGHEPPDPVPQAAEPRPESTPRAPAPPGGLTSVLAFGTRPSPAPSSRVPAPAHATTPSPTHTRDAAPAPTRDAAPPTRDAAPAPTRDAAPAPTRAAPAPAAAAADVAVLDPSRATPFETAQAIRDALAPRRRTAETDEAESTDQAVPVERRRLWVAGTAVLSLLLAGQIVNHYRNDLAANAQLNGPLSSVYAAFGVRLTPRWNLGAYEVRQLGASTGADAPGQITVRASVKNAANQSQPMPLLRVTLQDRFGNRIAARDVSPQSYLPSAAPGRNQLSAGQRIDAQMDFVDPGSNAVGFEIDACLPAPGGGVNCANDPAR
ncbi:MAG TPA: DUF3426 domain-containing protein [Steroidobacteraceae bacterium]|nr:DUF3426 domain-containing protein [Steroidobacteraceae bacterium]